MTTHIESLAAWAASVTVGDVPARLLDGARVQLRSVLASIYAGAETHTGRACRDAALDLGTSGNATVLPTGEKVHPVAAVLANASLSMVHDFDDYLFLGHTGHSAVLASMAVAETTDASVQDMLVAQVVANEIAGRLGAYVAIGPQNGQLWAHIHLAGAVVAAAHLYGMTAGETTNALAIAFYQPQFSLFAGFMASDAKALTAAQPAATGLHAVRLARNGMRGAREILEHRQGFASQFAFIPVDAMLGGLGRAWVSDSLSCKLYPGCAYIDGPVDAALAARGDRPLRPDEIDSIQITATALTGGMEALAEAAAPPTSLDPITVNFSAKRSVAIALLAGRLTPRELASDWRENNAAAIRALAGRTRLRVSANQTLSMLDGIGRAVPWSGLAREIGARRSWRARHRLRAAMRLGTRDRGSRGRAAEGPRISPRDALGAVGPLIRSLASGPRHLDMDEVDFQKLEFRFGAAVEIRLKGGGVLTGRQPIPLGAAGRPAKETDDLMIRKLHAECGAVGAGESAARIDELLRASAANTPARDVARAAVSSPAAV